MTTIYINYLDTNQKEEIKTSRKKFIVGRSTKADIVISREEFSRFHFELDFEKDEFFITDLNSTNGVFINGEKIPKGERIPYQLIFPIEIAGKVSIAISLDDENTGNVHNNFKSSLNDIKTSEETRTEVLPSKQRIREKTPPPSFKKKSKATQDKNIQFKLIGFGVLIFLGYLFYEKQSSVEMGSDSISSPDSNSVATPTIELLNLETSMLNNLYSQNQCDSNPEFCQNLKSRFKFDRIFLDSDKIIIFINLTSILKDLKLNDSFQNLPEKDQVEVILSRPSGDLNLLKKAQDLKLKHFIIVNFNNLDSQLFFKHSIQVNYQALLIKSKPSLAYFSDYYFGGMERGFKKFIKPYIKLTEF